MKSTHDADRVKPPCPMGNSESQILYVTSQRMQSSSSYGGGVSEALP